MAESKTNTLAGRELAGILLFTLSVFPLVLVALALFKGEAPEGRGTAAVAKAVVDAVGYLPALLCAGGFAALGVLLLLSGREIELGRHLSGLVFSSIGLAVILGAFHDRPEGLLHGGALGAATGGALRGAVGAWAGALIGGAILFVSVWLPWLGGTAAFSRKTVQAATISDALTEKDTDGVSAAEASALVPDASTLAYMEQLWRRAADSAPQTVPLPPSPYPEDVRLRGEVPDGAAPLPKTTDEPTFPERTADDAAAPGLAAAAQAGPDVGAGSDLAGLGGQAATSAHAGVDGDPFGDQADPLTLSSAAAQAVAGAPRPPMPPADPTLPEGARRLETDTPAAAGRPVPVWELDEAGAGTQMVRRAADAPELEEAELEEPEASATEVDDEQGEEWEEEEVEAQLEEEEDGLEDPEAEYEEEEGEEEEWEDEEAELEDEEAELEDEEAELEDPEAEYEEEEDEEWEEEEAELEEEDPEAEYEEDSGEEEDDDEEAEAELEEEEDAELDEVEAEADEDVEGELEDDEQAELAEEPAAEDEAEAELDELDEDASEAAEATDEPEVVLRPQPPSADRPTLVRAAGVLFVEQGRVAVSLLQRRFELDFDEACEVLDELQEAGLIGPYMGGQKRDILMTLQEWEAVAAGS